MAVTIGSSTDHREAQEHVPVREKQKNNGSNRFHKPTAITRVNEQVAKQHREVRRKEMTNIMFECLNGKGFEYLNMSNLNDLNSLLSQNIRAIERRI